MGNRGQVLGKSCSQRRTLRRLAPCVLLTPCPLQIAPLFRTSGIRWGRISRSLTAVDDRRYNRSDTDCRPGPGPTCAHRLFYTVGPYRSAVRAFLDKYAKSSEGFTFRLGSDS